MKKETFTTVLRYLLLFAGVTSLLIPIIGSFRIGIDVDSAIILTEMERIYEGYVPYKTLHLNYPPLWFYMMVALKWLFHVPYGCYPFYLVVHYLFSIGCAYFIYAISCLFGASKKVALFTTWLFLMSIHWLWGNCVLFEMPTLFYGLCASFLALKMKDKPIWHFLYIGTLACASFLCKQFGAGYSLLVIYLIVAFCDQNRWKKAGMFCIGYVIPLMICWFIWGKNIFTSILLNGYGTTTMELAGWDCSLIGKLSCIAHNLLYFCNRIAPIVYVALLMLPLVIRQGKWREMLFCVFGIGGFALQFYFVQGGLHYFQLLLPFGVLLVPILSTLSMNKWYKIVLYMGIGLMVSLSVYSTYRNRVYKRYIKNRQQNEQKAIAQRINELVPQDATVWVAHGGLQYLNYLCNLHPTNMADVGYACGPLEITKEKAWKQAKSCDYVIHFSRIYEYEYYFDTQMDNYLKAFPVDSVDAGGNILLRKMK